MQGRASVGDVGWGEAVLAASAAVAAQEVVDAHDARLFGVMARG
jgi:hypothetical protein